MALIRTSKKFALLAVVGGVSFFVAGGVGLRYYQHTSTNKYCATCHEMTRAYNQWKSSSHYDGASGVVADCVDCHLPPGGLKKMFYKSYFGAKDQYAHYFAEVSGIDWEEKKKTVGEYTFEEGCKECHVNLFPSGLDLGGLNAHKEYVEGRTEKKCYDCHENLVHKDRG